MESAAPALRSIHAGMVSENDRKLGARETVIGMIDANEKRLKSLNERQQEISDGIILMQRFSEGIQSGVVKKFEDLLTDGVKQIFNKDYSVSIEFSVSGNTMNADFFITLPDGKKVNLAKGEGGGLRDLVAVLQRILYLVLEPSHPAKIVFFDEDLKMLDSGRAPSAFVFIMELCRELEVQVVWITHQQAAGEMDRESMKVVQIGAIE